MVQAINGVLLYIYVWENGEVIVIVLGLLLGSYGLIVIDVQGNEWEVVFDFLASGIL